MSNQSSLKELQQRVIRVFISSTFRDMHTERDELVKFVFPELRRKCRERQVEFVEVDLRWGITEEESNKGKVLPICLDEIKRCKPYFIGLLGERYGWVPDNIPKELLEKEKWLEEHIGKTGKSVTELEILHGVLNNPDMAKHAFFYFRDPAYIKTIPREKQKDFTAEDAEGAEKLLRLKEEIRKSGLPVIENYPNPKKLGELVLKALWTVIDKKFPIEGVPTALERERMDHEAFAVARQKVYIGRDEYFKRLNEHIASAGTPLVVLGESGAGKSALIANWAKEYQGKHPGDFMVFHYIGGTADSADYVKILRRIMEEIKIREDERLGKKGSGEREESIPQSSIGKEQDEIPTDPEKVVEVFPQWLAKAAARGRFILVLDALNQLEDKDNAPDLKWLPGYFPENIRVILSTLPAEKERDFTAEGAKEQVWRRPWEALKKRGWQVLNVELLTEGERRVLVEKYLARFARRLSEKNTNTIVTAQQTSNPLYLKALLDELRVYGDHETLDKRINHYLAAQTVDDLYEKVLERLEEDYEQERKGLVGEAMSLIWASRRGLSEIELLELLGKENEPMPRAYWSPLYLALEESLVSRSGLLNFFHDYLRKAVEYRFFKDNASQKICHLRLADYYEKRETDDRKADELPWQLREAQEWERMKNCITNLDMFRKLMTDTKQYELTGYWLSLRDGYDMVKEYQASLHKYEQQLPDSVSIASNYHHVALFLHINAKYEGAELLSRRALAITEKVFGKKHPITALTLNNLADLLCSKGNYDGAEPLFRKALTIREKVLGNDHQETAYSLGGLATLLSIKGDYDEAEILFRRALAIIENVKGKDDLDTAKCLNNFAGLFFKRGNYLVAEHYHRRSLAIMEKVLGENHPDTATNLNNLATVVLGKGDYASAEPLYRRALEIYEKMLGQEHPVIAQILSSIATLLFIRGDYLGAESFSCRALEIAEKVLGKEHSITTQILNNLASLLVKKGDYENADPLFRRVLAIREKVLGEKHPDTATVVNNLGDLLLRRGDYVGAETFFRRSLEIRKNVLGMENPDTAVSLNNLAELLTSKGDYAGAEPLYRKALEIHERVQGKNHLYTAKITDNLGGLLLRKDDYAGAEPLLRRALEIHERVQGKDHLDTAKIADNLGGLLSRKGDYVGAETLFRKALEIRKNALGMENLYTAASLNNLAELLQKKGDNAGSEPLHRRALAIREKVLGKDHPDTAQSLNNLAELLQSKGDFASAEPLYCRALDIYENALGQEHRITATIYDNLAALFCNKGYYDKAEQLLRRSIEIKKKVLGEYHQDTATSFNGLAVVLWSKGNYADAEPFIRRAFEIRKKVLGEEHPNTLQSLNNMAALLQIRGDYVGAECLLRKALDIYNKVLGEKHPSTKKCFNNLMQLHKEKSNHI